MKIRVCGGELEAGVDERGVAVVIEDDDDIRELLTALLTQSGFAVHQAANGSDGVRLATEHGPVIVTVDLGLPDIDGFEVTRRLRRITDAYILMLTARTEEIDTLMGLDAGADDFVTKPFRPRELRARIEAMLRRPRSPVLNGGTARAGASHADSSPAPEPQSSSSALLDPAGETSETSVPAHGVPLDGAVGTTYELDGLRINPQLYRVVVDGRAVQLTPTEFILLRTLFDSGQIVRSKMELFRVLRDEEPGSGTFVSESDERTVEVHMGNLRRKLGDDPRRPRWIETLRGVGYRCAGTPRRTRGAG